MASKQLSMTPPQYLRNLDSATTVPPSSARGVSTNNSSDAGKVAAAVAGMPDPQEQPVEVRISVPRALTPDEVFEAQIGHEDFHQQHQQQEFHHQQHTVSRGAPMQQALVSSPYAAPPAPPMVSRMVSAPL